MRGLCSWNYVGKSNTQAEVAEEEAHLKLLMESRLHKQGIPEAGLDSPESTWVHHSPSQGVPHEHRTPHEGRRAVRVACYLLQTRMPLLPKPRLPPSPVMPAPRQQALYQRAAWDSCLAHSCTSPPLPPLSGSFCSMLS